MLVGAALEKRLMRALKRLFLVLFGASILCIWPITASLGQLDEADALNKRVIELFRTGKYSEATGLAQQALVLREKALGADHPLVAQSLNNLAGLYRIQGRYAEAEPLFKRALAINEKVLGLDHPFVATALNNLAGLYDNQGRYAEAEPLFKRALAIREKALGANHPDVATALNNLAELHRSQGRYAEAEPLYKRALAIREKATSADHPDVATALNNLALLYDNQGRYPESEPVYKRALSIREKVLGADHPDVANSLNNLALLYRSQGRYAEAEPLFKRALAINEKTLGVEHPSVATSLNNLAGLFHTQGRYAEAEPLYKRALTIRERVLGANHPFVATSLNNLALLYDNQGRYREAEPFHVRALAIREKALGADHPDVAMSLNNLALLYDAQGRHAEAEPHYKRALAINEKALGADHPSVATSLNNLAALYRTQDRYAEAESLYKRALAINEKILGADHPLVAQSLNNLAVLYGSQARYAEALSIVQRLISERRAAKLTALPVLLMSRAARLISPIEALTNSYEIVQRASSSAAGEAVSKLAARFAAGTDELAGLVRKDQDLATEADQLDKALIAAISKPPAERNATAEDDNRKRIEAIKTERERLQTMFNQKFPDYIALSKPQPLSLEDTWTLLDDDEAIIIFDFDTRSHAWIITRTNADWVQLTITAKDLETQVAKLRELLTDRSYRPFDTSLAHQIYQSTFGVFADRLGGKKRLSVITNGALSSLPPQLLVSNDPTGKALKDVDWLVRSYAVTILPSIASMKVLRGGSKMSLATKSIIAFADPVFSKAAREGAKLQQHFTMRSILRAYHGTQLDMAVLAEMLPQLPGTRAEVEAIVKSLSIDRSTINLGLAATETAVKQAKLDDYRIVYFATHGLVAGDLSAFAKAKAEPALALSWPEKPTEHDDGLLSASEVAQLKLDADWAVLSACNTAAEDKPGAEALSGLARAFFYAGARSLIVSHWPVSDAATAKLMSTTFTLQKQRPHLSHAEVLQQAMLQMIDESKFMEEADPRFWAPFVVVGEPRKKH